MRIALAFPCFLVVSFVLTACGQQPSKVIPRPKVESTAGLPVIELPMIELAKTVPRAKDGGNVSTLDRDIPLAKFVVRFDAKRPSDQPRAPEFLQVIVGQIRPNGQFLSVASDLVRPTNSLDSDVVHYEGVIRAPNRIGDAFLEVRAGNDAVFVRSAKIK